MCNVNHDRRERAGQKLHQRRSAMPDLASKLYEHAVDNEQIYAAHKRIVPLDMRDMMAEGHEYH